ncbi:MAG: hypothetical protein K2M19_01275 [Muribaculaceae bacterium]|nr:hypothetical protein [Muribaculaceae bacterium]
MTDSRLYTELLSESLSPGNFIAAATEAFGAADRNLRKEFAAKDPEKILAAVRRMFLIGRAYTMALRQQSIGRDYTSALLMMILNADMSGVDVAEIASELLDVHSQFLMQCGQLCEFYDEDPFALPHIRCITYMECAVFVNLVERLGDRISDPVAALTCAGLAEAARDRLSERAPEGCIPVEPLDVKSLLIDMFSRFNALGYF